MFLHSDLRHLIVSLLDILCSFSNCICRCSFENCRMEAGLTIRGRTGVVVLDHCHIYNCETGVYIMSGKDKMTVTNCDISNNEKFGVVVSLGCYRTVEFSHVNLDLNKLQNLHNCGGPRSLVTVNGEVIPSNAVFDRNDPDPLFHTLKARRGLQRAGFFSVLCDGCQKEESEDEQYCKCSKCEEAYYCSKECQVKEQ